MPSNPSRKTLPIAAAVVIALIVGVTAWKSRTGADHAPPGAGPGAEADADGHDAGAAAAAAARARQDAAIGSGLARGPAPVDRVGADGRISLLGSAADRERARQEYARLGTQLEQAHASQQVDPAWKGRTEASLSRISDDEALQASGIAPDTIRTDCRSSSCRISAEFASASDAQDWAVLFTTMTGGDFRNVRYVTVPAPGGGVELRVYGTRR